MLERPENAAGLPQPIHNAETRPVAFRGAGFLPKSGRWSGWIAILAVVALWQLAGSAGWVNPLFLPAPLAVARAIYHLAVSGALWHHVSVSIMRIGTGWMLGTVAGIIVGFSIGLSSLARSVGITFISALFPIPKIALLPLLILWLGIGEASKVAVITLGVFFPMAINTYTGVRHADPLLVKAAVSFGAGRWSVIRKVMLPSALPMIFAGLKLGAGTSLLLLVAAEMIAANSGIGFLILNAQNLMETTKLMVGIVLLSLLGLASHWLLVRLERVALPWTAEA